MKTSHPNSGTVIRPLSKRPLSAKTREILADSKARPVPMQSLNPGVALRLREEGCLILMLPSPYAAHKNKLIEHLAGPVETLTP